jgi:DNA-binding transcriptional LysR family regulator
MLIRSKQKERNMELKHIEAFVLALECGSISAAARRLHKGQPLVSQWISELEDDLGLALFQRSGNKTQATIAADTLLPLAKKLLCSAAELQQSAQALQQGQRLHWVLGIDEWLTAASLSDALVNFLQQWPQLTLDVQPMPYAELLVALQQEKIDLALCLERESHHLGFEYQRLGVITEVFVASPELAGQLQQPLSQNQLSEIRELVWSRNETPDHDEGIAGQAFVQVADSNLLLALLKQCAGYALLPRQLVEPELAAGELKEITVTFEQVPLERRVEMLWRGGSEYHDALAALQDSIRQHHQYR